MSVAPLILFGAVLTGAGAFGTYAHFRSPTLLIAILVGGCFLTLAVGFWLWRRVARVVIEGYADRLLVRRGDGRGPGRLVRFDLREPLRWQRVGRELRIEAAGRAVRVHLGPVAIEDLEDFLEDFAADRVEPGADGGDSEPPR